MREESMVLLPVSISSSSTPYEAATVTIQFKHSLRSGDRYISCLNIRREGVKLIFDQDIYRESDGVLAAKGTVESVIVENGRLTRGEYFDQMLERIHNKLA